MHGLINDLQQQTKWLISLY